MYERLMKGVLVIALLFPKITVQATPASDYFSFSENKAVDEAITQATEDVTTKGSYDDVVTNTDTVTVTYPEYTVVESASRSNSDKWKDETTQKDNDNTSKKVAEIAAIIVYAIITLLLLLRRRRRNIDA